MRFWSWDLLEMLELTADPEAVTSTRIKKSQKWLWREAEIAPHMWRSGTEAAEKALSCGRRSRWFHVGPSGRSVRADNTKRCWKPLTCRRARLHFSDSSTGFVLVLTENSNNKTACRNTNSCSFTHIYMFKIQVFTFLNRRNKVSTKHKWEYYEKCHLFQHLEYISQKDQ